MFIFFMKNIYWQRLIKDIDMNVTNHPIAHSKNGTYSNFIYWSSCWNHSANLIYSLSSIRRCARTKSSCVYANWVRKFYHPKFTQIQFDFRVGFRQRLFFYLILSLFMCGHKSFWFPSLSRRNLKREYWRRSFVTCKTLCFQEIKYHFLARASESKSDCTIWWS